MEHYEPGLAEIGNRNAASNSGFVVGILIALSAIAIIGILTAHKSVVKPTFEREHES